MHYIAYSENALSNIFMQTSLNFNLLLRQPRRDTAMNATDATTSPPERFNFAQHLIALNAGRSEKIAYIDDQGTLSYAALEARVRRCASALSAMGVRR